LAQLAVVALAERDNPKTTARAAATSITTKNG
jgi:hypothetical protein